MISCRQFAALASNWQVKRHLRELKVSRHGFSFEQPLRATTSGFVDSYKRRKVSSEETPVSSLL
jgi:hypothetical protein